MTIVKFCTNDLNQKKTFSGQQYLLMSNFSFLLKMSAMQLVFVSMALSVLPALATLILLELLYLAICILPYFKHKHLKNCLILIPKITQSVFLLLLEIVLLASYTSLTSQGFSLGPKQQNFLTQLIFYSNLIEYIFLALNIYLVIKLTLEQKKLQKTNQDYKRWVENSNSVLVYKNAAKFTREQADSSYDFYDPLRINPNYVLSEEVDESQVGIFQGRHQKKATKIYPVNLKPKTYRPKI